MIITLVSSKNRKKNTPMNHDSCLRSLDYGLSDACCWPCGIKEKGFPKKVGLSSPAMVTAIQGSLSKARIAGFAIELGDSGSLLEEGLEWEHAITIRAMAMATIMAAMPPKRYGIGVCHKLDPVALGKLSGLIFSLTTFSPSLSCLSLLQAKMSFYRWKTRCWKRWNRKDEFLAVIYILFP